MLTFLDNCWSLWLEAAPWLLFGLLVAGLVKAWFPAHHMKHWLGRPGFVSVSRAAVIGTPLPLCSCSVLPAAMQLHRSGASKGATVSFLISTPENGADSIALSYALLGPLMTIARPVAAIGSAIVAGLVTESTAKEDEPSSHDELPSCCKTGQDAAGEERTTTLAGLRYAVTQLYSDVFVWLLVGICLAALINTVVSPNAMQSWGSGLLPMIGMVAIGIPMYICATSSTPVAAAMLAAGVSPGTVLVFLLAGPATNLAGIAVVRRELGRGAVLGYLTGIAGMSIAFGLLLDWLVQTWSLNVVAQIGHSEMLPGWLHLSAAVVLILLALRLGAAALKRRREQSSSLVTATENQNSTPLPALMQIEESPRS